MRATSGAEVARLHAGDEIGVANERATHREEVEPFCDRGLHRLEPVDASQEDERQREGFAEAPRRFEEERFLELPRAEESLGEYGYLQQIAPHPTALVTEAISQAAITMAEHLKAAAILTLTESGFTSRQISKYRPACPIIAVKSCR